MRARNIILVIADGAGFNAWEATALHEGRTDARFLDAPGWVRVAASTYALRESRDVPDSLPGAASQDPTLVYDPARAWDPTPLEGGDPRYPYRFAGYAWLRRAPDSANTATTLSTGIKTYCGAINVDGDGRPVRDTLARLSKDSGRRVGVVTTVPFSHATPAALGGAHSPDRSDYVAIAREMLTGSTLDVIAGAGNPDFDHNGRAIEDPSRKIHKYVGGPPVWARLITASAGRGDAPDFTPEEAAALDRWTLKQSLPDIEALTHGTTPEKLLMVPEVGQIGFWTGHAADPADSLSAVFGATLQQDRGSRAGPRYTEPGYDPPVPGIPSLATLTRAALNALDDDPDGFFLHIEGGAVDWAMHGNQAGRMIEEMIDLDRAVEAVVAWVEAESSWDETLLIVTADHDHLLWGPDADRIPFDPLRDRGAGNIPGYRWLANGHSAALVPVFAKGVGSAALETLAVRHDPRRGKYLDQADLFAVIRGVL